MSIYASDGEMNVGAAMRTGSVLAIFVATILGGCGNLVPEIRDFPNNMTTAQNIALVHAIIRSIRCELRQAVTSAMDAHRGQVDVTDFYNNWGAEVALTLQLEEKSTLSPTAVWMPPTPPTQVFTLGGGLSGTSDATRIDKINYRYTVRELYLRNGMTCERDTSSAAAESLLSIQSDLKLAEWLDALFTASTTEQITGLSKQNVISHQITFQLTTSGNVTPAWKLVRATINQGGTLFSTSRDRKHDLLITFGIIDKTKSTFLQPIAENTHITSQISTSLRNVLINPSQ